MSLFFSIIIPSRGENKYLIRETLPALHKQTYNKFEVILLPSSKLRLDGLIKQYPWLKIIQSKSMPGIKRDTGVKKSKGDIVVFIDDDAYPPPKWLDKLNDIYINKIDIAAVGGPGILPINVNMWEKIFDISMQSFVGTGGFSYRFVKQKKQFVEDFPSMNLSMKKNIFLKLGGFKNKYWPGEDSKLINALIKIEHKYVFYDPDVYIYHHRRENLPEYLTQHKNYGYMRGKFLAHGDGNSRSFIYKVPSIFTLYTLLMIIMSATNFDQLSTNSILIISFPLLIYFLLLALTALLTIIKTKKVIISLGLIPILFLTHLTYGLFFISGFLIQKISSKKTV